MPNLRETIDRLVSEFATDIMAALREVPIGELTSAVGFTTDTQGAPRSTRRPPSPRSKGDIPPKNDATSPAPPDPRIAEVAAVFFEARGSKGATVVQLHEHLKDRSFAPSPEAVADVVSTLAQRGVIRDAGFRRTTGSGTAPVFVVAS